MPTKRRKTGVRQRGALTYAQRSFLVSGRYLFNFDEKFRDDDEVCEAWACHRDGILADWCHPGERPPLLWKLDAGLTSEGWPDFWAWPEPFETESDLVRAMVLEGELVGCRFTGNNRIESEVAAIEADWLHAIHVALQQTIGRPQADPFPLTEWRGVPRWFFDRHAPAVKVEIAAERSAWRRSMARYSDTA